MLDIDHFTWFNDTYGHDAGDTLLQAMGAFLQQHSRSEDSACRYGGEAFTVMLPGAALADTQQRTEELRMGMHYGSACWADIDPGGDRARGCGLS